MGDIFRNLDWSVFTGIIMSIIPALLCITLHELSHGYIAYRLGDMTAKEKGRLTLNPIKHIDVFGLLMMVLFRFGWAKPVPVNMMNFKHPKRGMAITAFAGPASNIVLAVFVLFVYGLIYVPLGGFGPQDSKGAVALEIIERTAYISVALAVFNLLPIPPLDGSKVLFSLLSDSLFFKLMRYERFGVILLILFINAGTIFRTDLFNKIVVQPTGALFEKLAFFFWAAFRLVN